MDLFTEEDVLDFKISKESLRVALERPITEVFQTRPISTTDYVLPSSGRKGLALILNIVEFNNDPKNLKKRIGSEQDVEGLTTLLIQLEYDIYPDKQDKLYQAVKTKEEMNAFIQEFKSKCEEKKPKSIIVFVGSHGVQNFIETSNLDSAPPEPGEKALYGSMHIYSDIVYQFSFSSCPDLKKIPKIFLIQACQKFSKIPTNIPDTSADFEMSDYLICTPTIPGTLSTRDYYKGSWFPYCFTYMMMKYALKMKSLREILHMVGVMMGKLQITENDNIQVPTITSTGFSDLYFAGNNEEQPRNKKYYRLPSGLDQFLLQSNNKFCILHTLDNEITSEKITEHVEHHRFHEWKDLVGLLDSSDFQPRSELNISTMHFVKNCTITNMNWLFQATKRRTCENITKLTLITTENKEKIYELITTANLGRNNKIEYLHDQMDWHDLSLFYQFTIAQTLEFKYKINLETNVELNGLAFVDFIGGRNLFNETVPRRLPYYVKRTVVSRNIISADVFEEESKNNIFVITDITWDKLSALTKKTMAVTSEDFLDGVPAKVIYLNPNTPNHFKMICKRCFNKFNVHLLQFQYISTKLKWIESVLMPNESLKVIRSYIASEAEQDDQYEDDFCLSMPTSSNHPVCISDSPGMGKSWLLQEIGRTLKLMFPKRTVIFLEISYFIHHIKAKEIPDNLTAFKTALLDILGKYDVSKAILKSKIESGNILIELLLDGFDEVNSADVYFTLEFLQNIRTHIKSVRLWLTTRPHLMNEMENQFNVLGYNMQPFTRQHQEYFLTSFWSREVVLNQDRILNFAKLCLDELNQKMSPADKNIAGIPLQCKLIGEVYEDYATSYADVNNDVNIPPKIIDIGTIANLYKLLMEKKREKYNSIYGVTQLSEKMVMTMHVRFSLQVLFPEEFSSPDYNFDFDFDFDKVFDCEEINKLYKIGIFVSSDKNGCPQFIHRTFAEYFVSWFAMQLMSREFGEMPIEKNLLDSLITTGGFTSFQSKGNFSSDKNKLTTFLLEMVLKTMEEERRRTFAQPVIAFFINSFLEEYTRADCTNPSPAITSTFKELTKLESQRQFVHACGYSDLANMLSYFDAIGLFRQHADKIYNAEFLLLLVEFSGLKLVTLGFSCFEKFRMFTSDIQNEVLRLAVKRGNCSIVEFLFKEKGLRNIVEHLNYKTQFLLHDCVMESFQHDMIRIHEKKLILSLLVGINNALLEIKNQDDETPLFLHRVNIHLLIKLVDLGANIFATDENRPTILHDAFDNYSCAENYHMLAMKIASKPGKLSTIVNKRNVSGKTPLQTLVGCRIDPLVETIDLFKNEGADFNLPDGIGLPPLRYAILHGCGTETLNRFIKHGAKAKWIWKDGTTLLHVAAEWGHFNAIEMLVDNHGLSVNAKDNKGRTPLDIAIQTDHGSHLRNPEGSLICGRILHKRGGTFQVITHNDKSLLHVHARKKNLNSVKLLVYLGMNVNAEDDNGNTPLHCAVMYKRLRSEYMFPITKFLLDHQANPNAKNKRGMAPIRQLIVSNSLQFDLESETFDLLKGCSTMDSCVERLSERFEIVDGWFRLRLGEEEYSRGRTSSSSSIED